MLSQRVLIGRGLDLELNRDVESKISSLSEDCYSVLKIPYKVSFKKRFLKGSAAKTVSMAVRIHLFPSRTQKLSSLASKILGWRRPGKIDRRRHNDRQCVVSNETTHLLNLDSPHRINENEKISLDIFGSVLYNISCSSVVGGHIRAFSSVG